jgi:cytochrome o ubiquinol oxidase subunit 2
MLSVQPKALPHARERLASMKRILAVAAGALQVTGCSSGVLDPQGPIAAANRLILMNALVITLAIVLPTMAAAVIFAWWFRESNGKARYRPDFAYSGRLELIVWSVPLLTIVFLGGLIWIGSHRLDPARPIDSPSKPVDVQVVSLDWKWLFIYPDQGVASVNELVVPASTPVHFLLTSASVMNTFFVPQLGSMIYTMNGMVTQLNLQADHPGDFLGESGMFSGDGFSDMRFTVRALTSDAFATWVTRTKQSGPGLDKDAYQQLAKQSQNVAPFTYRMVDPALFHAIVTQMVPPSSGPIGGRGGAGVNPRPEG